MPAGEGIKIDDDLLFGLRELKLQQRMMEIARGRLGLAATVRTGLVLRLAPGGDLDTHWLVADADDDGTVEIRSTSGAYDDASSPAKVWRALDDHGVAVAYDEDGVPFTLDESRDPNTLTVPNDNTWYTLVAEPELTEYAEGTLDTAPPSVTLSGDGTRFTDLLDYATSSRGSKILIEAADSALGNDGVYEVDTVTDDEDLDLRTATGGAAESSLRWKVAGNFAQAPAERAVLSRRRAAFSLVSRTRKPAAGQIVLADVKRNDTGTPKVQIIDRRRDGATREPATTKDIKPRTEEQVDSIVAWTRTIGSVTQPLGVAPTRLNGWIVLYAIGTTVYTRTLDPTTEVFGSAVAVAGSVSGGTGDLIQAPVGTGYTHYAVTSDNVLRGSPNNGATWSSLGTIWTAPGGDSVTVRSISINRWGRLIALGAYLPGGVAADAEARYVFSDDYGATWQTNAGQGWVIVDNTLAAGIVLPLRIRHAEDGTPFTLWLDSGASVNPDVVMGASDEFPDPVSPTGTTDHLASSSTAIDVVPLPGGGIVLLGAPSANVVNAYLWEQTNRGGSAGLTESRRRTLIGTAATLTTSAIFGALNRSTQTLALVVTDGSDLLLREFSVDV